MKPLINIFLMPFMLVLGCEQHEPIEKEPLPRSLKSTSSDTVSLAFNEKTETTEDGFWVQFSDLTEESRCPANANCIQPGNAQVELMFFDGLSLYTLYLNTNPKFQSDTVISDLYLELLKVSPYPSSGTAYNKDGYSIQLFISGLEQIQDIQTDVEVTVRDYFGLDGCGWVLEPDSGKLLEPVNLPGWIDYHDGQRLKISYSPAANQISICMVGIKAKIYKIELLPEQ